YPIHPSNLSCHVTPTPHLYTLSLHDAFRSLRAIRAPRPDSIFNGADDDASGSMAMLEIAEAMAAGERPLRSILFVWHTAEEAGQIGRAHAELQSRENLVCRLLLEKKNKTR